MQKERKLKKEAGICPYINTFAHMQCNKYILTYIPIPQILPPYPFCLPISPFLKRNSVTFMTSTETSVRQFLAIFYLSRSGGSFSSKFIAFGICWERDENWGGACFCKLHRLVFTRLVRTTNLI